MCKQANSEFHNNKLNSLEARQRMEKTHHNGSDQADKIANEKVYIADFLALTIHYTRNTVKILSEILQSFRKSTLFKNLNKTTQPAHLISITLVIMICNCIWGSQRAAQESSMLSNLIYLGSFCAHFGCQIWMTFVSGLALYFSLPRHIFGRCQEILFPKYFLLNAALSCMTLITFAKLTTGKSGHQQHHRSIQLVALSLCALIEMLIYLYLTPTILHYMRLKYTFEGKLGNGQEVGHQEEFDGIQCPRYREINGKFRSVHIKCAIGNIMTICCSFFHLFYLAARIKVV